MIDDGNRPKDDPNKTVELDIRIPSTEDLSTKTGVPKPIVKADLSDVVAKLLRGSVSDADVIEVLQRLHTESSLTDSEKKALNDFAQNFFSAGKDQRPMFVDEGVTALLISIMRDCYPESPFAPLVADFGISSNDPHVRATAYDLQARYVPEERIRANLKDMLTDPGAAPYYESVFAAAISSAYEPYQRIAQQILNGEDSRSVPELTFLRTLAA